MPNRGLLRFMANMIHAGLLAASLAPNSYAGQSISRMYRLAQMPVPKGWKPYRGHDTWPGVIGRGNYRLALAPALPPGQYRVQVRTLNVPGLALQIAGQEHRVPLVRGYFSGPVDFVLDQPVDSLVLSVRYVGDKPVYPIIQAVYLTSDLHEIVGRDDLPRQTAAPAPNLDIPAAPILRGNYLENSSFEVGAGHGWGKFWPDQLDTSSAADGRASLRMPVRLIDIGYDVGWVFRLDKLESKLYRLPPGKYAISGWFRADRNPKASKLSLSLAALPTRRQQYGQRFGTTVNLSTEWKHTLFVGDLPEAPGDFWSLQVYGEWRTIERGLKADASRKDVDKAGLADIPTTVWVDALQVELLLKSPVKKTVAPTIPGAEPAVGEPDEADELDEEPTRRAREPSAYRCRGGMEVGARIQQPGHILYPDEPAGVALLLHNPEKQDGTLEVCYRVEDYFDAPVVSKTLAVQLKGKTHVTVPLDVPSTRHGIFRLVAWHAEDPRNLTEQVFSVLPRNPHLDSYYPAGRQGTDNGLRDPKQLAILKRAGCNWVISKTIGRWGNVHRKPGVYQWQDDAIRNAREARINILGQLFVNGPRAHTGPLEGLCPDKKAWGPAKKRRYLAVWGEYVRRVVENYKDDVRHWEITNEPYFWCTPDQYAEILRVASEAIRRVDPGIHVIGFCSANMRHYFPAAVAASAPKWYDGMSGHFYDSNPQNLRQLGRCLVQQRKTGWQTEAGSTHPSFYRTLPTLAALQGNPSHTNPLDQSSRDRITLGQLKGELRCYGIGRVDHYFHYFSRFVNATPSQPTRPSRGKEDVEYDGALRPYGVARSIAGHMLNGLQVFGEWRGDRRLTLCLFGRDGQTTGFVWSNDGRRLTVAPRDARRWKIFDWFGNPLAFDPEKGFAVDAFPRYFRAPCAPQEVVVSLDQGKISGGICVLARLVPEDGSWRRGFLKLALENEAATPQAAALLFGGVLGGYVTKLESAESIELLPHEKRLLTFPLAYLPTRRNLVVGVRQDAQVTSHRFTFPLAPASQVEDPASWQKETEDAQSFSERLIRTGPGNRLSKRGFTPAFRVGYDANRLYVLATVTDDSLSPSNQRTREGQGDQVHFLIAAETRGRAASEDPAEVLARVPSESDRYVIAAPSAGGKCLVEMRTPRGESQSLAGARSWRTEDGYRLFVPIPWSALGMTTPRPGSSLVFNVVAFDADGVNAEQKIEWPWAGGEAFVYGDPAGWGELVFE